MQEFDHIPSSISIQKQQQHYGSEPNQQKNLNSRSSLQSDNDKDEEEQIENKMMEGRVFLTGGDDSARDQQVDEGVKNKNLVGFGELGIDRRFGLVDQSDSSVENQNNTIHELGYFQAESSKQKQKSRRKRLEIKKIPSFRKQLSQKKKKPSSSSHKKDKTINHLSLMTTSQSTNPHKNIPKIKKKNSPYHHLLIQQIQKNRQLESQILQLKQQNGLLRNIICQFNQEKAQRESKYKQIRQLKVSKGTDKKIGKQSLWSKKAVKTEGSFDKQKENPQRNLADMKKSIDKFISNSKLSQSNKQKIINLKSRNNNKIWKKKAVKADLNSSKRVL